MGVKSIFFAGDESDESAVEDRVYLFGNNIFCATSYEYDALECRRTVDLKRKAGT